MRGTLATPARLVAKCVCVCVPSLTSLNANPSSEEDDRGRHIVHAPRLIAENLPSRTSWATAEQRLSQGDEIYLSLAVETTTTTSRGHTKDVRSISKDFPALPGTQQEAKNVGSTALLRGGDGPKSARLQRATS